MSKGMARMEKELQEVKEMAEQLVEEQLVVFPAPKP